MSLLGELLYKIYYQPKNEKAYINKFGGRKNYFEMRAAEQEMRDYALNDLIIDAHANPNGKFNINFLTGDQFIHQTLFCTYSFLKFLAINEKVDFSVNYYSDGTMRLELVLMLKKRFPGINIVDSYETETLLQHQLPLSAFPSLNRNVRRFPLFKKLIYPNLNATGLSIFFDSDMLFLKRPADLLSWLYKEAQHNDGAFCIQDVQRSYGYSDEQIARIWPNGIMHDINSGLYALHSKNIDWKFFEILTQKFEENYGTHYYMEQLMTAILMERSPGLFVAPKSEYIVFPSREQISGQIGTLHHYVNESKEYYFKEGWRYQLI